jgi:hypothetical protein
MSKILFGFKNPQHTYLKRSIYYYSRIIPKDLTNKMSVLTASLLIHLNDKDFANFPDSGNE